VVHLLSCSTAMNLDAAFLRSGCGAFIGYTSLVQFGGDSLNQQIGIATRRSTIALAAGRRWRRRWRSAKKYESFGLASIGRCWLQAAGLAVDDRRYCRFCRRPASPRTSHGEKQPPRRTRLRRVTCDAISCGGSGWRHEVARDGREEAGEHGVRALAVALGADGEAGQSKTDAQSRDAIWKIHFQRKDVLIWKASTLR